MLSNRVDKSFRIPDYVGSWMEQTVLSGCPRFAPKWISSEQHQQLRHILEGKVCRSQSTNLSFLSYLTAFIDWYVFSPFCLFSGESGNPQGVRVWKSERDIQHKEAGEKARSCTVPSSSLQGRACTLPRESQHAWLLSVCLEYVLESAVERVGFVSPRVGSWLVSHLNLRGPSRKTWAVL